MSHLKESLELRKQSLLDRRTDFVDDNPYIVVGGESLVESYKRNKASLHLHFLRRGGRNISHAGFCAVIAGSGEAGNSVAGFIKDGVVPRAACDGDNYPPMLVRVGEVLQVVKGAMRFFPLASYVRLCSLDFCHRVWGDPLQAITSLTVDGGVLECLGGDTDRELITFFGFVASSKYQLPYKVVKSTPEIMNAVSDHEWDIFGDWDEDVEPLCVDFRVWIALENQFAHLGVKIPARLGIERLEMCFCPVDLLPNRVQRTRHDSKS